MPEVSTPDEGKKIADYIARGDDGKDPWYYRLAMVLANLILLNPINLIAVGMIGALLYGLSTVPGMVVREMREAYESMETRNSAEAERNRKTSEILSKSIERNTEAQIKATESVLRLTIVREREQQRNP